MGKNEGRRLTELRTSNAAGTHQDKRTKRKRGREAVERNALADAWDEGYTSHDQGYTEDANPYREEDE
jgi:hypothetical protein